MAEKQMTQKEMFAHIMEAMAHDAEVVAFCEHKIEQLSKERKPRKTAEDVLERRAAVMAALAEAAGPMANKAIVEATGMTPGQATGALRYLVEQGKVLKFDGEKSKDPKTYALAPKAE